MDVHFGFTDMTTALTADRILFNSETHFDAFFEKLPKFLKMMPDFRPVWIADEIRSRAGVLHPGCTLPKIEEDEQKVRANPPLIIWNHRWEFDKNPEDFFLALDEMVKRDLDFNVALLGENFQIPRKNLKSRENDMAKKLSPMAMSRQGTSMSRG